MNGGGGHQELMCRSQRGICLSQNNQLTLLELGFPQANDKLVYLDHEFISCFGPSPHWIS
jgi:hypothetical protein